MCVHELCSSVPKSLAKTNTLTVHGVVGQTKAGVVDVSSVVGVVVGLVLVSVTAGSVVVDSVVSGRGVVVVMATVEVSTGVVVSVVMVVSTGTG